MQYKKDKNEINLLKLRDNSPLKIIKRIAITTIAATTIALGVANINPTFAESNENDFLNTVYYVYIDGEFLGTVNDKQEIEQAVNKKIQSLKDTYKGLDLSASNLTLIPEIVFHPVSENKVTMKKVNSKLAITTKAVALQVEGKPVAYFIDEETAERAVKRLKLKYVSNELLNILEENKKSGNSLPPLKKGQSRVLDVKLDKKISVVASEAPPQQILTVDDGAKLLQKGTLEEKKYKVKEGDVLGGIAIAHDLSLDQLLALNPGLKEDSLINIDDELNVTQYEPYLRVIVEKEFFSNEQIPYETEIKKSNSMYKGDTKTKQEGKPGEKLINYVVTESNGTQIKRTVLSEEVIKKPINKIVVKGTKVTPSRGSGSLAWPTNGGYISSTMGMRWGNYHKGIDIARPYNYTIKAADNGVVTFAGWDGGFGNKIIINHNNGMRTLYAHLSKISVRVGQTVAKGSQIGVMGTTGNSTGTHLHFEVYKNGDLKNPLSYLR